MFKKISRFVGGLKAQFNEFRANRPKVKELLNLKSIFGIAAGTVKDVIKKPLVEIPTMALAIVLPGGIPFYFFYRASKWHNLKKAATNDNQPSAALAQTEAPKEEEVSEQKVVKELVSPRQ